MNWYKRTGKGLYNQPQADEHRSRSGITQERYIENELIEGEHIKALHSFFLQGRFTDFNDYVKKLRDEGFSESRIASIVGSATRGKIPATSK